ncbi:glycoside hydrolase family 3 N-terminal domain-containing protein [Rhodanobacter sp. DHB23]|uniref:glycoside hydrolase family 3 N-terminal domain-containing protein n=1 Tax=Rhodanobacter sp. DHB23 TaxID=2775923 RepID=UPI001786FF66|nr:glycoside hydrolase family 3 N-terminal domain-containing protein [Rhodanobacter sp. DHB23]MBD8874309.1 glycoside hydrolase family 3 C-terminal domain-containing protein [Rhodanobacter sp. DHB23]
MPVRYLPLTRILLAAALAGAPLGIALGDGTTTVHPALWPQAHWPLPADAALEQRVAALMAKMSVEDKVGQLIQADIASITPEQMRQYHLGSILAGGNSKPGGGRFATAAQWKALADAFYHAAMDGSGGHTAIPPLFGIDAVHGDNGTVGATLFPQNSTLGNAHDPALLRAIGAATAAEVRATGLNWSFAPTLAVPQDLRWGRAYEGYSQDPRVVASYAGAMVEGLQGTPGTRDFLDDAHAIASAKHFLADGGTKDGKDQGDAQIDERTLIATHAAGYPPAIAAGVQTVMASFSSWNGVKMLGNKGLLTDVLKRRMDFQGFVVGDWNAHGQIPGCSNVDCPAAYNNGADMLMAPDSWRGLYEHTLAEVKSGAIPMARVDDAVARILRVKFRMGLFTAGAPSTQPLARDSDQVVGSAAHRALARRAVRESLVLLKNDGNLLPLDPHRHILVAGEGADSISQQSGGWTLTWQGTGLGNADFPGAQSIGAGIAAQAKAAGGTAEIAPDGHYKRKPDVAVVVFGESPYAEFQGDIANLLFHPGDDHDLELIRGLRAQGIPVVAVFLSGRPLWVNREINAADAFVAAGLPGSEGGGVADVLLRKPDGTIDHDFHGTLAFAWPGTAVAGGKPQFPLGYGLTYADHVTLPKLPEQSGVSGNERRVDDYLEKGKATAGYTLSLAGADGQVVAVGATPAATADDHLRMTAIDYKAQEDARRLDWNGAASLTVASTSPIDLDRQTNGDVMLVATLRVESPSAASVWIGMGCGHDCRGRVALGNAPAAAGWQRVGIPLKCLRAAGADMHHIVAPFVLEAEKGARLAISGAALGTNADRVVGCPR